VEAAVDGLCEAIGRSESFGGMELTRRFSPGYGDWPLTVQKEIVDRLKAGRIGVRVNESCVLIPEKTITAVAGLK
jgi:cobalamin-dependent methionine synthase I